MRYITLVLLFIGYASNAVFAHGGNEFKAKLGGEYYLYDTCGECYSIGVGKEIITTSDVYRMRCLEDLIIGKYKDGKFFAIDRKTTKLFQYDSLEELCNNFGILNPEKIELLYPNPYIRLNFVNFENYYLAVVIIIILLRIFIIGRVKVVMFSLKIAGLFSILCWIIGLYFCVLNFMDVIRTLILFVFLFLISCFFSFIANQIKKKLQNT